MGAARAPNKQPPVPENLLSALTKADDYVRQPKILVCGNSSCHGSKAHTLSDLALKHTHTHKLLTYPEGGFCAFIPVVFVLRKHKQKTWHCNCVLWPAAVRPSQQSLARAVKNSPTVWNSNDYHHSCYWIDLNETILCATPEYRCKRPQNITHPIRGEEIQPEQSCVVNKLI